MIDDSIYPEHRWPDPIDPISLRDFEAQREASPKPSGRDFDGTLRCSSEIGNPALVMRIDGTWDVVEFATYRRIGERLGRREAEFLVSATRNRQAVRREAAAKVERSLSGVRSGW